MIFSFFAVQIGHAIVPAQFAERGLLLALATFGVGFFMRPLGAIVIGRYGDRAGRKPAMMWSFGLMGVSILGTALTPSYAHIGIAAPVLLLCFRLLQGFAFGGEVGPITAYAAEAAPHGYRARYVSMLGTGQGLAVLCSGLIGYSRTLSVAGRSRCLWLAHRALLGVLVVPIGLDHPQPLARDPRAAAVAEAKPANRGVSRRGGFSSWACWWSARGHHCRICLDLPRDLRPGHAQTRRAARLRRNHRPRIRLFMQRLRRWLARRSIRPSTHARC